MKCQRRQALNETSSSDSDDIGKQLSMRIRSKNPFVKLAAFIKIRKLVNQMNIEKLQETNKKLIFGIFNREEKAEMLQKDQLINEVEYQVRNDSIEPESSCKKQPRTRGLEKMMDFQDDRFNRELTA